MSFRPLQNSEPPSWNRTLYILVFVQIVTTIGFSSIFPFLPLYVASLESVSPLSTEVLAGLVFSAQALTMTIASPFWGVLADKWGRKPMVVRATLGGAVIVLLMAFVRTAEELVFLRFIQGMITGVVGSMNALVAGIVPRERMGYAMGLMQVGGGHWGRTGTADRGRDGRCLRVSRGLLYHQRAVDGCRRRCHFPALMKALPGDRNR